MRTQYKIRNTKYKTAGRRGFTLMELIVVMLILGVAMAILLPPSCGGILNAKITNCGSNLSQLTKAMYNYSITKGPIGGGFPGWPSSTGGPFYTSLYATGQIDDPKFLLCPVMEPTRATGANTDYRGPRTSPAVPGAHGALGCDRPGNHGTDPKVAMNWVGRSGDVHKTPADAARWAQVLSETSD